jgi:hypothetical protein
MRYTQLCNSSLTIEGEQFKGLCVELSEQREYNDTVTAAREFRLHFGLGGTLC